MAAITKYGYAIKFICVSACVQIVVNAIMARQKRNRPLDFRLRNRLLGSLRIRQLDHYAEKFLQLTHLTEQDKGGNNSLSLIKKLPIDRESIIDFICGNVDEFADALKDAGTSDFITGLMETHEKIAGCYGRIPNKN